MAVVGIDLFEAASGIVGAIGLVVGFMNIPVSVLIGTPFVDFTIPALIGLGALLWQTETHSSATITTTA